MREIELTQGRIAFVDDEDFKKVNQYKWYYHKEGYARRNSSRKEGKQKCLFMHNLIVDVPEGFYPDHHNGNGLDNRKENLRIATNTQNQHNAKIRKDNKSGHRGISLVKGYKKWQAGIKINGRLEYLGYFNTKQEAVDAYHKVSKPLHGEFARCCDEE